ncbi:hypothetical protein GCM10009677_04170 [Sphaerisporangium rubeum]|uniref:Sporulation protein YlmC with PRC-barrel domain n=1 Tax=Sphaerisporangium rubeum TaxID=321317 RepID=A0A7X0I8S9_9ACTN|nr:hypothetical protein [Sphaerisporangium rubeum]MBB6470741.1 sporulation protein YlmC with PRC-barrel domain [Sphaerisporangium rubeum]
MTETARVLHAQLHLLDRQVVRARDGRMVCKVDDLETALDAGGRPYVTALLYGPLALGPRVGGVPGALMTAVTRLLRPEEDPAPRRIPMSLVSQIGSAVQVGGEPGHPALERWARDNIVSRIPGSGDAATDTAEGHEHPGENTPGRGRLSALIGLQVTDASGATAGQVADVRLTQDGPLLDETGQAFQVAGFVVVPRHTGQLFGYERGPGGQAPLLVRVIIRRLHRGSRYVPWSAVGSAGADGVRLTVPFDELPPLTELYRRTSHSNASQS